TSRRTRARRGTATSRSGNRRLRRATRARTNTSGFADGRAGGRGSRTILGAAGTLAAALCLAATLAAAQSPAVNPTEMGDAKAQQQRQVAQPLNNPPVWSEVPSAAPQVATVQ